MHYNGANNHLSVKGFEIYQFKATYFGLNPVPLFLCNASKKISTYNLKKTEFYRYIYDFWVDYDNIDAENVLHTDKSLMKNHERKICFNLIRKWLLDY